MPYEKMTVPLLTAVTSAGNGVASIVMPFGRNRRTIMCDVNGTGAVTATVTWYGLHDVPGYKVPPASGGVLLATSSLSGTTTDQTGADIPGEWPWIYCVPSNITGTGAAVDASVSI